MQSFSKPHTPGNKLLFIFMVAWLLLNLLQAAFVGIDGDEAYYWLYAQHLQWGYFDHPPLIALSIKLGERIGHGPFYTRLCTVLFSTGTVYFGFKALPDNLADVRLYLLAFTSAVLFHVYGFIATPDASLLFFTTLFFYAYKRFLEKETLPDIILLAFSITGLLYSKYHGVLPVIFTLLSHPKLLFKRSSWAVVLLVSFLFSPHLWWQYQHNWPTVRYHLSERIASSYEVWKTLNYIASQLFIWGPFTTIPALFFFSRTDQKYSRYEQAHLFTFWGVFLFFFFSSFRSTIEPHWTLVAGPSFVVLLLRVLHALSFKLQKLFVMLSGITILLILICRVLFAIPGSSVKEMEMFEPLVYAKGRMEKIYRFAQGRPVVFADSYRLPALYQYYHPEAKTWGYNTVNYRKTQYNNYDDAALNNTRVYIAGTSWWKGSTRFLKTPYDILYLQPLDSFKAVNALKIKWLNPVKEFGNAKKPAVIILLENTGEEPISTRGLSVNYTFLKTRNEQYTPQANVLLHETSLTTGCKDKLALQLALPTEPGTYDLIFSVLQPPMAGTFASPFYKVIVD